MHEFGKENVKPAFVDVKPKYNLRDQVYVLYTSLDQDWKIVQLGIVARTIVQHEKHGMFIEYETTQGKYPEGILFSSVGACKKWLKTKMQSLFDEFKEDGIKDTKEDKIQAQ